MNTAVVYYSLEGNTQYAAEKIAGELGADLLRLLPVKEYPTGKLSKYFRAGKSATFGEAPKLEAYRFEPDKYNLVILGTPVWAGTLAPPLRTFLRENKLTGRNIALFACCSGGSTEKCFAQLENSIGASARLSTLRLVDPLDNKAAADESIAAFCTKLKARPS